jgi:O-antigen ligase
MPSGQVQGMFQDLVILAAGLLAILLLSRVEPVRGWALGLLRQRRLLAFLLPLVILFGWPSGPGEAFREGVDLGGLRLARIALFLVFGAHLALVVAVRGRIPRLAALWSYALYVLWCGVSALWSPEPFQTLWKTGELAVLVLLAVALTGEKGDPVARARDLAGAIAFLAFALCVTALAGGLVAPDRAWPAEGLGMWSMRGVVPQINANMLGQLGGMVAVIAAARLMIGIGRGRAGEWIVLSIGLAALLLAYSRTALITAPLVLVLTALAFRRWTALLLMAASPGGIALVLADPLRTYLARGQSPDLFATLSGRTLMWEEGLAAASRSPIIGHGFFVGHKYVERRGGIGFATMDNTHVETLINLGAIGLVLVLAIAVFALGHSWRLARESRRSAAAIEIALVLFVTVHFVVLRSLAASSFQILHYNAIMLAVALPALWLMRRGLRAGQPPAGTCHGAAPGKAPLAAAGQG